MVSYMVSFTWGKESTKLSQIEKLYILTIAKSGNRIKAPYVRIAIGTIDKLLDLYGGKEKWVKIICIE